MCLIRGSFWLKMGHISADDFKQFKTKSFFAEPAHVQRQIKDEEQGED